MLTITCRTCLRFLKCDIPVATVYKVWLFFLDQLHTFSKINHEISEVVILILYQRFPLTKSLAADAMGSNYSGPFGIYILLE